MNKIHNKRKRAIITCMNLIKQEKPNLYKGNLKIGESLNQPQKG